jgi:hypothetical protein
MMDGRMGAISASRSLIYGIEQQQKRFIISVGECGVHLVFGDRAINHQWRLNECQKETAVVRPPPGIVSRIDSRT